MNSPTTSETSSRTGHAEEAALIAEQIKKKVRARKLRSVRSLATRMQIAPDGSRRFVRFSRVQCLEHQFLIVTFTILAITGLLQRYSQYFLVGLVINLFGGVETVRTVHHLAAVVFILQSTYHAAQILVLWFVKREPGAMWPKLRDLRDLAHMVAYNLGLAARRPEFDRFSVEEKLEYWALLWGTPLMIITGLIMWFPVVVTSVLPGDAIPVSQALHGWEAILATLAILTWHMYHTVIKTRNRSVFSGIMSEKEMMHEHPLEYRRILAARNYLQKLATEKVTEKDNSSPSQVVHKETHHEVV